MRRRGSSPWEGRSDNDDRGQLFEAALGLSAGQEDLRREKTGIEYGGPESAHLCGQLLRCDRLALAP